MTTASASSSATALGAGCRLPRSWVSSAARRARCCSPAPNRRFARAARLGGVADSGRLLHDGVPGNPGHRNRASWNTATPATCPPCSSVRIRARPPTLLTDAGPCRSRSAGMRPARKPPGYCCPADADVVHRRPGRAETGVDRRWPRPGRRCFDETRRTSDRRRRRRCAGPAGTAGWIRRRRRDGGIPAPVAPLRIETRPPQNIWPLSGIG